jgi:hypothetical protein
MSFKPTPHLLITASAVLVALVAALPVLLFGGGSWATPTTVLRIVGPAADSDVYPATVPVGPLIADYDHAPDLNPFNPRAQSSGTGVPAPPPPTLEVPPLPMLPLAAH